MENPYVTILIPTYKRAHLLDYVLNGLIDQTYKNFEILVLAKPSGDETQQIVDRYSHKVKIRLIPQKEGYMLNALNIGLQSAKGQIILFLDDDAIPFPNLVEAHVKSYRLPKIGGVTGDVMRASLDDEELRQFKGKPSDILPNKSRMRSASRIAMKLWNKPLEGQENYLFYISKAGVASMNVKVVSAANQVIVKSLLARGVNMSVLLEAIGDFRFPTSWILGFTYEQYLGWHIWQNGYTQIFNPDLKVYHLEHGQSLSRNFKLTKRETLLFTEQKLLYYRLNGLGAELSLMHRIVWLMFEILIDVKRICVNKELHHTAGLKSTFYSIVIGFKMILQKRLHLAYSPLPDLEKLYV